MNNNDLIVKMKIAEYENLKNHLSQLRLHELNQTSKENCNSTDPKTKALKELQNLKAKPLRKEITETTNKINKLKTEITNVAAAVMAEKQQTMIR